MNLNLQENGDLPDFVDSGWRAALGPVTGQVRQLGSMLREENRAGRGYLPAGSDILRAFTHPFEDAKVLIVGQDPYPTPGHPMGLAFSVAEGVQPPPSLRNIFQELNADVGPCSPVSGDLSGWANQGVVLLNRVLTVTPGAAGSHRGRGWEAVTEQAITALVERDKPLVAILWGRDAQSLTPLLRQTPTISSPHPSPLSAYRGFFGSKPFSRANELLAQQGADPIDWTAL